FNADLARKAWGYILQEELGWTEFAEKDPDLHFEYSTFYRVNDERGHPLGNKAEALNVGKQLHWLRYLYRYPVWDAFKAIIQEGKMGAQSSAKPELFPPNPSRHDTEDASWTKDETNEDIISQEDWGSRGSGATPSYVQCKTVGLKDVLESKGKVTWMGALANSRKRETLALLAARGGGQPLTFAQVVRNLRMERDVCPKCHAPLIRLDGCSEDPEEEAAYSEQNDWGDLERDTADVLLEDEAEFKRWTSRATYEMESSSKTRLARFNHW
ncbi:MAG: hypothetical protein ACREBQ_12630, partial [Nitrososphaerales archaeon]